MYTSIYAASSLLTVALAAQLDKRQDAAAIASSLSSLSALLQPPPTIAAELTGIPASAQAAATDPASYAAVQSEFASGIPSWFATLPSDAQSYVLGAGAVASSVMPQISSLESAAAAAGITGAPTAGVTGNGTTVVNGTTSSGSSSSGSSTKSSTKGGSGGSTESATSTSATGNVGPTNAVAAGVAGLVGFAGLIMAL